MARGSARSGASTKGSLTPVEFAKDPVLNYFSFMESNAPRASLPKTTRIGHVHLKVADLDRALSFWRDVIGFEVTQRYGRQAVFLSIGGYHHLLGLNTWESLHGSPPSPGTTGLYHLAILLPTREALSAVLHRVLRAGVPLDGAADHGVSQALYLRDPDGNGVELYWDYPEAEWPRDRDGNLSMGTKPLDLDELLSLPRTAQA